MDALSVGDVARLNKWVRLPSLSERQTLGVVVYVDCPTELMGMSLLRIDIRRTKEETYLNQAAFLKDTLKEVEATLVPRSTPWDHRSDGNETGEALDAKGAQRYRKCNFQVERYYKCYLMA